MKKKEKKELKITIPTKITKGVMFKKLDENIS